MEDKKFSPFDSISFGFKGTLEHIRLFFLTLLAGTGLIGGAVAIVGILNIGFIRTIPLSLIQEFRQCFGLFDCISIFRSPIYRSDFLALISTSSIGVIGSVLVLAVIFAGFDFGLKKIALDVYDRNTSTVGAAFSCFHLSPQGLIAWCLYLIMIWIGWLFFIVPGFIALLCFSFFPYFIIDKNVGPLKALSMSFQMTKGHIWDLFGLWAVVKIIVYLGSLTWIGVLFTWPLSVLAYAYVYRKFTTSA